MTLCSNTLCTFKNITGLKNYRIVEIIMKTFQLYYDNAKFKTSDTWKI